MALISRVRASRRWRRSLNSSRCCTFSDTLARSKGRQRRLEIVVVIAKLNQRLLSENFQQALPQLRRVGCRLNDGGQEMLL